MFLGEDLSLRWLKIVAVEDAVEAVASSGGHLNQLSTMGHESPQLSHMHRRHPNFRDEIGGQEVSQAEHIVSVGFDACFSDPLDLRGMSDDHSLHQGNDLIVDIPGVGGGFEDDGIRGEQVGLGPSRPLLQGDTPRVEYHLLAGVDAADNEIVLVQVESQETLKGRGIHRTLLREKVSMADRIGRGADFRAERYKNRYGFGLMAVPDE
jgi:hypothetical protein